MVLHSPLVDQENALILFFRSKSLRIQHWIQFQGISLLVNVPEHLPCGCDGIGFNRHFAAGDRFNSLSPGSYSALRN
jgi:hypothetical protein